mmetsp:Transcript_36313/g.108562  ORF Transcript_36313/g.108562 Transcript_36313/m.108562 type:complete len:214 (+) Transcript_36313:645-1286(+)
MGPDDRVGQRQGQGEGAPDKKGATSRDGGGGTQRAQRPLDLVAQAKGDEEAARATFPQSLRPGYLQQRDQRNHPGDPALLRRRGNKQAQSRQSGLVEARDPEDIRDRARRRLLCLHGQGSGLLDSVLGARPCRWHLQRVRAGQGLAPRGRRPDVRVSAPSGGRTALPPRPLRGESLRGRPRRLGEDGGELLQREGAAHVADGGAAVRGLRLSL